VNETKNQINIEIMYTEIGDVIIYLPNGEVEQDTIEQIKDIRNRNVCSHIRCMPDCHPGQGCVIGMTGYLLLNPPRVIPDIIGVDIGCGVYGYKLPEKIGKKILKKEDYMISMEAKIKESVAMGFNINKKYDDLPYVPEKELQEVCNESLKDAKKFCEGYFHKFFEDISSKMPNYTLEWVKETCNKIDTTYDNVIGSLGTLGGGNHFIECAKSEILGSVFMIIHSGSRNFGLKICNHHMSKMSGKLSKKDKRVWINTERKRRIDVERDAMMLLGIDQKMIGKKLARFAKTLGDTLDIELCKSMAKKSRYLEGDDAFEYIFDMIFAQNYAKRNRRCMMRIILNTIGETMDESKDDVFRHIESIHNYIDFTFLRSDGPIVRKGAISAKRGEMSIIPLNMKDGSLICCGLGNAEWNYSAPHGAGRKHGRREAKREFTLKQFRDVMDGVYSTCIDESRLDEAPFVYKDVEMIERMITGDGDVSNGTVQILDRLRPIFNLKG